MSHLSFRKKLILGKHEPVLPIPKKLYTETKNRAAADIRVHPTDTESPNGNIQWSASGVCEHGERITERIGCIGSTAKQAYWNALRTLNETCEEKHEWDFDSAYSLYESTQDSTERRDFEHQIYNQVDDMDDMED